MAVVGKETFDQSEAGLKDMSSKNIAAVWPYHVTKFRHQASTWHVLIQKFKVVLTNVKFTEPETTVCYKKNIWQSNEVKHFTTL